MADILMALIDECQNLPQEVLEAIMAQFMDKNAVSVYVLNYCVLKPDDTSAWTNLRIVLPFKFATPPRTDSSGMSVSTSQT